MRYASRDPPEVRRTGGWRRVGMTLCQLDGRAVAGWIEVWDAEAEDGRSAASPGSRRPAWWSSFAA